MLAALERLNALKIRHQVGGSVMKSFGPLTATPPHQRPKLPTYHVQSSTVRSLGEIAVPGTINEPVLPVGWEGYAVI